MDREFIVPNWHVALVHFPIGLLIAGTLIELFSFLWRRHAFRAAGRWMILLGALSGVPVALSGVYALADVTRGEAPADAAFQPWSELSASSGIWQDPARAQILRDHVVLMSFGVGLSLLVALTFLGASDNWRGRLSLPLLAVLLIAVVLVISGAWHGGEAVYRHGVGVHIHTQDTAVMHEATPATLPATQPATAPATWEAARIQRDVEYFLPPMQVHVLLAGCTIALALAAVGLSFRAANLIPPNTQVDNIAAALGPTDDATDKRRRDAHLGERVPSARFWLLTFLFGVLTVLGGWWVLAGATGTWDPQFAWNLISRPSDDARYPWLTRRMMHVGGGSAILVLSLLLAMVARFVPRSRIVLLLAMLLIAVVAAQVWLGILMLYDTPAGPVTRFN